MRILTTQTWQASIDFGSPAKQESFQPSCIMYVVFFLSAMDRALTLFFIKLTYHTIIRTSFKKKGN